MTKLSLTQFLSESPLPDDWDGAMYNERIPFAKRVRYAQERAKKLGTGSSRIAFVIPYQGRDTVLKVAKNRKGMAQNEVESQTLNDYMLKDLGLFIPLIDYDEANDTPTWIHTEMAQPAKESHFVQACGGQLLDLLAYASKFHRKPYHGGNPEKVNGESELAEAMVEYIGNWDANIQDYRNIKNWGIYQGRPVIIDAGYNNDVQDLYFPKQSARW